MRQELERTIILSEKKKCSEHKEFTFQSQLLWDSNKQKWRLNKMKCYTVNIDQGITFS